MSTIDFEAWLERTAPIQIGVPIYQSTKTTVNFTVIDANRTAVNLTGYTIVFAGRAVNSSSNAFSNSCTIDDAAGGLCSVDLSVANLADSNEYLGELALKSDGTNIDNRIQFRFEIAEVIC